MMLRKYCSRPSRAFKPKMKPNIVRSFSAQLHMDGFPGHEPLPLSSGYGFGPLYRMASIRAAARLRAGGSTRTIIPCHPRPLRTMVHGWLRGMGRRFYGGLALRACRQRGISRTKCVTAHNVAANNKRMPGPGRGKALPTGQDRAIRLAVA